MTQNKRMTKGAMFALLVRANNATYGSRIVYWLIERFEKRKSEPMRDMRKAKTGVQAPT